MREVRRAKRWQTIKKDRRKNQNGVDRKKKRKAGIVVGLGGKARCMVDAVLSFYGLVLVLATDWGVSAAGTADAVHVAGELGHAGLDPCYPRLDSCCGVSCVYVH